MGKNMKEILDIFVWIAFIILLAIFIIGFNKQQIQKHKDKIDELEKKND